MGILRTPMTQDRAGISSLRRRAACPSRPAAPVVRSFDSHVHEIDRQMPFVGDLPHRQSCGDVAGDACDDIVPAVAVCISRTWRAPPSRARKRRTVPYRSPYQPQCLEGDDGDDVCHGQAQQDGSRRDFRAKLPSHFGDRCKTWRVGEREQQEGDGRRLAVAVR